MKFSGTKNKITYLYRFLLIIIVINIIIYIFLFTQNNKESAYQTLSIVFIIELILYIIPLMLLFFNYRRNTRNIVLEIKNNNWKYQNSSKLFEFKTSDIKIINLHLSYPLYHNNIRLFFWDEYFYYEVILKNNERLIISCLNTDKIQNIISDSLFHKKLRVFPIIKKVFKEKQNIFIEDNSKRVIDLIKKYKNKSNSELENIINSAKKYENSAIKAAKILLKDRNGSK